MSVETPEYAAMMRRMVRAYGRRVAAADDVDLGEMQAVHEAMEDAMVEAVRGQRARGTSWAVIGLGLGTTRQAAHARFAHRIQEPSLMSRHDDNRSA